TKELARPTQPGKGPAGATGQPVASGVTLLPRGHGLSSLGCSYTLDIGYAVKTEASAIPDEAGDTLPLPDRPIVGVIADTPPTPLPSDLRLSGTATVPVGPV